MIYKGLRKDGTYFFESRNDFKWPLPTKRENGTWEPGKWVEADVRLVDSETHKVPWLAPALFEAEYDGECRDDDRKMVVQKARLLRRLEGWDERAARSYDCDCWDHAIRQLPLSGDVATEALRSIASIRQFADEETPPWSEGQKNRLDAHRKFSPYFLWNLTVSLTTRSALTHAFHWAWETAFRVGGENMSVLRELSEEEKARYRTEREWQARRLHEYLRGM